MSGGGALNFKKRLPFLGSSMKFFTRGNVVAIGYRFHGFGFVFTGLCISVRYKKLVSNSTSFILRNIFSKISVELYIMLYGICRLNFKFLNYAKKKFMYRGSKLYYLRNKANTESLVN